MWPLLVVVVFPLWWMFVVWLIGLAWRRVAREYPASDAPMGDRLAWQSARIGTVRYNGAIVIHRSPQGLHLQPWGPFKVFHPPIFLPWSALHHPRERWGGFVELDLDRCSTVRLHQRVIADAPIQ